MQFQSGNFGDDESTYVVEMFVMETIAVTPEVDWIFRKNEEFGSCKAFLNLLIQSWMEHLLHQQLPKQ